MKCGRRQTDLGDRRGTAAVRFSYEEIHAITKIDKWFIDKLAIIVEMEETLKTQALTVELLKEAKRIEFPDSVIAKLTGKTEENSTTCVMRIKSLRHTRW